MTELLSKGNALNLLANEQVGSVDLFAMARDVVAGLNYLHSKAIIHADLALRNVLVALRSDDEATYIAKVSALASQKVLITADHCVITCRELFNNGRVPYLGLSNEEVIEKIQKG